MSVLFLSFRAEVSECLFKLAADTSAKKGQEPTNLILLNEKSGMDKSCARHEMGCLIKAFSSFPPTHTKFLFFSNVSCSY